MAEADYEDQMVRACAEVVSQQVEQRLRELGLTNGIAGRFMLYDARIGDLEGAIRRTLQRWDDAHDSENIMGCVCDEAIYDAFCEAGALDDLRRTLEDANDG